MATGGKHPVPVHNAADADFAFIVGAVHCGDRTVGPADLAQLTTAQFCLVNVTVRNNGPDAALLDPPPCPACCLSRCRPVGHRSPSSCTRRSSRPAFGFRCPDPYGAFGLFLKSK
jgi:hypothetical protein